jgi:hypothetical protein
MTFVPTSLRRSLAVGLLLAFTSALLGHTCCAQSGGAGLPAAVGKIKESVFSIEVHGSSKQATTCGSAVLMAVDSKNRLATFATAYHVLLQAKSFSITDAKNVLIARSADGHCECFVDRSRELALLRVPLATGAPQRLAPILTPNLPLNSAFCLAPIPGSKEFAIGYPQGEPLRPYIAPTRFTDVFNAQQLNLVRRGVVYAPAAGEYTTAGWMSFGILDGQPTHWGMSGGLVANQEGQLSGVIYGLGKSGFSLMMPASELQQVWARALTSPWKPFQQEGLLDDPCLFDGGKQDEARENRLDWKTEDGFGVLFSDDPVQLITSFQEITIPAPRANADIKFGSAPLGKDESITFWLNGQEVKGGGDGTPYRLRAADLAGESLLVVSKTSGRVGDFELGGLIRSSTVDLTFFQGDDPPFYHLVRSLPRMVQTYLLFITIDNPGSAAAKNPLPPNGRLAVKLEFLEALLNAAPFDLSVKEHDAKDPKHPELEIQGVFSLDRHKAWSLQQRTFQQIAISLTGDCTLQKALYNKGLQFEVKQDTNSKAKFTVEGRLQFPQSMRAGSPYLSARATGTKGTGSFRIKIDQQFSVEAAGFLRYLLTTYLNHSSLCGEGQPSVMDARIQKLLAQIGLSPPPNCTLNLRQACLRDNWFILTFRIAPAGGEAPGNAPVNDLTEPPSAQRGIVFDLTAQDVPADFINNFPALKQAGRLLSPQGAGPIGLHVSLGLPPDPSAWFQEFKVDRPVWRLGEDPAPILKGFSAALKHFIKSGTVSVEVTRRDRPANLRSKPVVVRTSRGR